MIEPPRDTVDLGELVLDGPLGELVLDGPGAGSVPDGPVAELAAEVQAGATLDVTVEPPRPRLPLPRWLGPLAALCSVALVPWTIYLGLTLPRHTRAAHYDTAWVGFDIAMLLVLGAMGWAAWQRRPFTGQLAAVAATLLVVDAWFDVVTSARPAAVMQAVLSAVVLELPLAAVCAWVAINAERVRTRAYRRLWVRAQLATRRPTREQL